jgi:hypothetical protein
LLCRSNAEKQVDLIEVEGERRRLGARTALGRDGDDQQPTVEVEGERRRLGDAERPRAEQVRLGRLSARPRAHFGAV